MCYIEQCSFASLKALCHYVKRDCFLTSSLVQKFNESGYRKNGHAQHHSIVHGSTRAFVEIEHACSAKTFGSVCDCQVKKHSIFSYGQPNFQGQM